MPVPPDLPLPSPEEVERFRRLFLKEKGVLLSDEDAYDQALRLVRYVFLVERVMPRMREAKEGARPEGRAD